MSRTQLWVNAYEISQMYGGAEEGGWFFDAGVPIWSKPGLCSCPEMYTHSDACPITHLVKEAEEFVEGITSTGWDDQFISRDPEEPEHRGERVYGKTAVRIEEVVGRTYPDEWPHYE